MNIVLWILLYLVIGVVFAKIISNDYENLGSIILAVTLWPFWCFIYFLILPEIIEAYWPKVYGLFEERNKKILNFFNTRIRDHFKMKTS